MGRSVWGILVLAGCSSPVFIPTPASSKTEVVVVSDEANAEIIAATVRALDDPPLTLEVRDQRPRNWNVLGIDREPCDLGLDRGPLRFESLGDRTILKLLSEPSATQFHGTSAGAEAVKFYPGATFPQDALLAPLAAQRCDRLLARQAFWTPESFGLEGSFQTTGINDPPIPQLSTSGSRIALLVVPVPPSGTAELVFLDTATGRFKVVHGLNVGSNAYAIDLSRGLLSRALVVTDDSLSVIDEDGTTLATAPTPGGRSDRLVLPSQSGQFVFLINERINHPSTVLLLRTADLTVTATVPNAAEIISGSASGPEGLTLLTKNGRLVQRPPEASEPATLQLGEACGTSTGTVTPRSLQRFKDGWVVILDSRTTPNEDFVALIRPAQLRSRPTCVLIDSSQTLGLSRIPGREDRGALVRQASVDLVDLGGQGPLGAHQLLDDTLSPSMSTLIDEDGVLWTLTASVLQPYAPQPRPEVAP